MFGPALGLVLGILMMSGCLALIGNPEIALIAFLIVYGVVVLIGNAIGRLITRLDPDCLYEIERRNL